MDRKKIVAPGNAPPYKIGMTDANLIFRLAADLGVKPITLRSWKHRGEVPHRWRLPILDLAKKRRKRLKPESLSRLNGAN